MIGHYPHLQREREIWQACDDLVAMGKTVREITGEAIAWRLRELHYKAGSKTYIYKYRDSWMAARGYSRETSEAENQTALLSDPIARATAVFKEGLERELRREYQQKYDELQAQLLEKEGSIKTLQDAHQQMYTKHDELSSQYQILSGRYEQQSADWTRMHEEAIGHKMLINQLQTQLTQVQTWYEEMKQQFELSQQLTEKTHQASLQQFQKSTQERLQEMTEIANAKEQNLVAQIESYKKELHDKESTIQHLQHHNTALNTKLECQEPVKDNLSLFNQKLDSSAQHLTALIERLIEKQLQEGQNIASLLLKYANFETSLASIEEKHDGVQTILQKLEQALNACVTECNDKIKTVQEYA